MTRSSWPPFHPFPARYLRVKQCALNPVQIQTKVGMLTCEWSSSTSLRCLDSNSFNWLDSLKDVRGKFDFPTCLIATAPRCLAFEWPIVWLKLESPILVPKKRESKMRHQAAKTLIWRKEIHLLECEVDRIHVSTHKAFALDQTYCNMRDMQRILWAL